MISTRCDVDSTRFIGFYVVYIYMFYPVECVVLRGLPRVSCGLTWAIHGLTWDLRGLKRILRGLTMIKYDFVKWFLNVVTAR